MTRPQLCGRIHTARLALDLLWSQVRADGGEPFRAIGRLKCDLIDLEAQLRRMDGAPVPMWPHDVHADPAAEERLRTAGADLAEVLHTLAVTGARGLASARHHAQALEETARIRELAELNRIPPDELVEHAPTTVRALARGGAE